MTRDVTRRRFLAGGAVAALTTLAGCSGMTPFVGKRQENSRRIDVGSATALAVDLDVGDVTLRSADREDVHVRYVKKASSVQSDLSDLEFSVARTGGRIRLESVWNGESGLFSSRPTMDLEVTLPRSLAVESVRSDVGDLDVAGLGGDLTAAVSTGDVTVSNHGGDVSADSQTGDVSVEDVDGSVSASVATGDVTVRSPGVLGDVSSQTGDVEVDVPAIDGDTTVETQTGDVDARIAGGLDADFTAETSTGDVDVEGVTLSNSDRDEEVPSESVRGTLGEGGPRLLLSTTTGDVTVRALE